MAASNDNLEPSTRLDSQKTDTFGGTRAYRLVVDNLVPFDLFIAICESRYIGASGYCYRAMPVVRFQDDNPNTIDLLNMLKFLSPRYTFGQLLAGIAPALTY